MSRYQVVRSETEVDDVLNECIDAEAIGEARFPGMTFEMGVRQGIEWLTDEAIDHPLDD